MPAAGKGGKKGKGGGKVSIPCNPFERLAVSRPLPMNSQLDPTLVAPGEFADTALEVFPHIAGAEASLTIQFRCTVRIAVGDSITLRLPGFGGPPTLMTLENRKPIAIATAGSTGSGAAAGGTGGTGGTGTGGESSNGTAANLGNDGKGDASDPASSSTTGVNNNNNTNAGAGGNASNNNNNNNNSGGANGDRIGRGLTTTGNVGGSNGGDSQSRTVPFAHHFLAYWSGGKEFDPKKKPKGSSSGGGAAASGKADAKGKGSAKPDPSQQGGASAAAVAVAVSEGAAAMVAATVPTLPVESLVLQCIQSIEANQVIVIGTPLSALLTVPEKLPLNSSKLKIEGNVMHSEGEGGSGKIGKQSFLMVDEVRKRLVEQDVAELDGALGLSTPMPPPTTAASSSSKSNKVPSRPQSAMPSASAAAGGGGNAYANNVSLIAPKLASANERVIAEDLSVEEIDQLWEAAHERLGVTIGFTWTFAVKAFHSYDTISELVKSIAENTVACVKRIQQSPQQMGGGGGGGGGVGLTPGHGNGSGAQPASVMGNGMEGGISLPPVGRGGGGDAGKGKANATSSSSSYSDGVALQGSDPTLLTEFSVTHGLELPTHTALALHYEIAANLNVKVAQVVMLEEVWWMLHGSAYTDLPRSCLLALRLFTMETVDLMRVFGVLAALPQQQQQQQSGAAAHPASLGSDGNGNNEDASKRFLPCLKPPRTTESTLVSRVTPLVSSYATMANTSSIKTGGEGGIGGGAANGALPVAVQVSARGVTPYLLAKSRPAVCSIRSEVISAIRTNNSALLKKWSNFITALLVGTTLSAPPQLTPLIARQQEQQQFTRKQQQQQQGDAAKAAAAAASAAGGGGGGGAPVGGNPRSSNVGLNANTTNAGGVFMDDTEFSYPIPVPVLYFGQRGLPHEELTHIRSCRPGEPYVLASFALASPIPPWDLTEDRHARAEQKQKNAGAGLPPSAPTTAAAAAAGRSASSSSKPRGSVTGSTTGEEDESVNYSDVDEDDSSAFVHIPHGAVLFELRDVCEGVEMSDIGQQPMGRNWLMPFCSTFVVGDVYTYGAERNHLTHVTLYMQGSLGGGVLNSNSASIMLHAVQYHAIQQPNNLSNNATTNATAAAAGAAHNISDQDDNVSRASFYDTDAIAEVFPVADRNVMAMMLHKSRTAAELVATPASQRVARYALLYSLLRSRRLQWMPSQLSQARYVQCYARSMFSAQALRVVEESSVAWEVCTAPPTLVFPENGTGKAAAYGGGAGEAPSGGNTTGKKAGAGAGAGAAALAAIAATLAGSSSTAAAAGGAASSTLAPETLAVLRPEMWESVPKKTAVLLEECFLKRTRDVKQFDATGEPVYPPGSAMAVASATAASLGLQLSTGGVLSGGGAAAAATSGSNEKNKGKGGDGGSNAAAPIVVDLQAFTADFGGKGHRKVRRLVGRVVTHQAPLPLPRIPGLTAPMPALMTAMMSTGAPAIPPGTNTAAADGTM